MSKHVLIVGMSGSGKSRLAKYFRRRGKNAMDADDIDGLADWYARNGRKVVYDAHRFGQDWISTHKWNWDRKAMRKLLRDNKSLYLFGGASNMKEFYKMFDDVYYLKISKRLLDKRLAHPTRRNPLGAKATHRKVVLGWVDWADKQAERHLLITIKAWKRPREIYEIICGRKKK